MNIAAAMAALRLAGVDDKAKHALLVLAARCPDRHTVTVTRSLPALAADMGVSERTARRAVAALRRRGYVQVVHRVGITSTYTLSTPDNVTGVTPDIVTGVPRTYSAVTPDRLTAYKRKTREKQESDARPLAANAAGVDVDNPRRAAWQPDRPPHPPECECEGVGLLEVEPGRYKPCGH